MPDSPTRPLDNGHEPIPMPVWITLIPVGFLLVALALGMIMFEQSAHVPLILAATVAGLVAMARGVSWHEIQRGMLHGITLGLGAILILMAVGTMIGTWILGGIVPTIIVYGLKAFSPGIFLVATTIICAVVSLGTGSSWSTVGTVGVALMGVGQGLGVPVAMVAGAIVSGSYFGDKMSPLSDTTNLAAGVTGTDLFTHIRHMLYTTVPSLLLALALYGVLGWRFAGGEGDATQIDLFVSTLETQFTVSPLLLLPPVAVIVMVVLRVPPLPAILAGAGLGGVFALSLQDGGLAKTLEVAYSGYVSESGVAAVDSLLSRGGLIPMMDTVALIMCALAFGGIMERTGMLSALTQALLRRVRSTGSLVLTTAFSAVGVNAMAADQYLSIIVPGRMFSRAFEERNLDSRNLSRCLEDTGTLTSPLIPWNSCGAFVAAALGVSPWIYAPYAFLNLINPLLSIAYGYTGITMVKRVERASKANQG